MSAAAADVMNRDRDLDPIFDLIEREMAALSYMMTRTDKAFRMMSTQTKKGRAGQELSDLIDWLRGRHGALRGELMRLRQAED